MMMVMMVMMVMIMKPVCAKGLTAPSVVIEMSAKSSVRGCKLNCGEVVGMKEGRRMEAAFYKVCGLSPFRLVLSNYHDFRKGKRRRLDGRVPG